MSTPAQQAATQEGQEATSQAEGTPEGQQASSGSEPSFSDEQKAYVEKLRKENASWRNKHKDLVSKFDQTTQRLSKLEGGFKKALGVEEGTEVTPEDLQSQLEEAQTYISQLETKTVLTELALENGLTREDVPYLNYLMQNASGELVEGEEMSEEQLEAIIAEAKSRSKSNGATNTQSSVGTQGQPNPQAGQGTISLERFSKMNVTERSLLYQKSPQVYNDLMAQAKDKRTFV